MSCCFKGVPPELVDFIIDHLHDDRKSLTCCSLVSRHWLPASRKNLYRKLRLTILTPSDTLLYRNSIHRLRRTWEVLSSSPHLVTYIRHLHLACFNTSWGRVNVLIPAPCNC
ncbi:hypothetical protein BD779DRAFT_1446614 [Infundibulicybe gibba]|nr:hypothetical protein BD779DRAFT_1446614 [Infundibulicybe gibba]